MLSPSGYVRKLIKRVQGIGNKNADKGSHRLQKPPSREDVVQAFRLILGREPENKSVIEAHMRAPNIAELRRAILLSPEFAGKYRTMHPEVGHHPNMTRARRTVVFIHLLKTGGTSLRGLIGKHFLPERRCPIFEDKLHVLSLAQLSQYDYFAGHFDISCLAFIPRDAIETVSVFREPQARLVSLYRFLRSHPMGDEFAGDQLIPLAHALTAEQFFERPELRGFSAINNHYLFAFGRSFSWFDENRESLSSKMLSSILLDAKLQLSALSALGITEQFRESAYLICRKLDMEIPDFIEKLHVTDNFAVTDARFRRVERVEMTPRLAAGMRDLVEHDINLYQYALSEFHRRQTQLSGVGSRFEVQSKPVAPV
jgi:hypothetical protein